MVSDHTEDTLESFMCGPSITVADTVLTSLLSITLECLAGAGIYSMLGS